jgi:hypothetical protein
VEIADRIQEYLGGQFEPDTLLPVQYNELMRRRSALEGERKLMFAVLEDAVECYLKHMNAKSRRRLLLFYEVQNWMNAKNRVGLFSYQTLCESLGIDAKALRAALESRLKQSRRLDWNRTSDIAAAAG